jgi:hypothetical protein
MKIEDDKVRKPFTRLMAAACSVLPMVATAESGRHAAHVHGVAELTLAQEGRNLEIGFTSPAMSILGFEHQASNPTQIAAANDARAKLRDTASLFTFAGAMCKLQSATVDMTAVLEPKSDHHSGHSEHELDGESHADISAHYEYVCGEDEQLKSLRVGNTDLPFALQKINVMWILGMTQGATVLTPEKQLIQLN